MAWLAYDAAKSAIRVAKVRRGHDSLIADVHRAQADALAENLHRRDIGEIERAELMAKWVEITAKREAEDVSAQVAQKLSSRGRPEGRKAGGVAKVARDLGVSRDQIARATKIAALSPEAKAAGRKAKAPHKVLLAATKGLRLDWDNLPMFPLSDLYKKLYKMGYE